MHLKQRLPITECQWKPEVSLTYTYFTNQ